MTMSSPATIVDWATARPWTFAVVVIAAMLVVVAIYGLTGTAYINHDVFVMAKVAQTVLAGKTLYGTSCWDNKPPLTLLACLAPQWAFPHSNVAIQAFLGLWLVLQGTIFAYFQRHDFAAATIAGTSVLTLGPLLDREFLWASSEHWHNLFALLVLLPSYHLRLTQTSSMGLAILAGASIVMAMHCRQTGILLAIVPLTAILAGQFTLLQRVNLLFAGFAGAVVAFLGILAVCSCLGDMHGYFDATFLAPGRYSESSAGGLAATVYFYLATYRSSALSLLVVASLAGIVKRDAVLIAVMAITMALIIVIPKRTQPHYLTQSLPVIAICVQASVAHLATLSRSAGRGVAFGIVFFLATNGAFAAATLPFGRGAQMLSDLDAVAAEIRAHSGQADTMFAVGSESAYLYFATDSACVHPIFWDLFFGRLSATIPYPIAEVLSAYESSPPDLLAVRDAVDAAAIATVSPSSDVEPCEGAVRLCWKLEQQNHYREVARVRGWVIRRRDNNPGAEVAKVESKAGLHQGISIHDEREKHREHD